MNITLSVETYKGVDGSSLSSTRCDQIVQVYEMLELFGSKSLTYIDIQEEAQKRKLFGETNAKSAIRTFFPLLKKIGFVNYDNEFDANRCFTELGTQFVLACRALHNVSEDTPNRDEIISHLVNIKQNAQKQGLVLMYLNADYKRHNMWIALKLLKELPVLNWNEFLYALHCIENDITIEEAIEDIKQNKKEIDEIEFVNEKDEKLPNICYSYLRSFLEEAGLIQKVNSNESKLINSSDKIFTQILL